MQQFLDRRRWILAAFGSATLAGCAGVADSVGSAAGNLGLSRPPAPGREIGFAASAAQTATIRAAYAGDAKARADLVTLGYRSPQQVVQSLNTLVQGRRGGTIKVANFRAESQHNSGLDGASLTLYEGNGASSPRWWVDIKVYADAGLNTVVEGVYKVANTPRGPAGEGHDLTQDLRRFLGVSTFDDRLPPALLFKGHFAGF